MITHVETTQAHISDVAQTEPIHKALANKALLPEAHVVDAGYVDGTLLLESLQDFGIELIGPVRPDVSWQYLLLLEPLSPTVASFRGFLHIPRKDSFQYATSESCVENMLFLLLSSS